ncbi:MAG: peptide ABC transporter substrate-binding protein [Chloroflexi bacterium]|nr:peptide ABC transporter substrate-binding protein [Chloroflexota bacterium]
MIRKSVLARCVLRLAIVFALVAILLPTGFAMAEDATVTILATYQDDDLVVLDLASGSEISSLDPQVATDIVSITPIENLFHGLTDYDPITSKVVPEMATNWDIDPSGTVWTFHLRDDVMWYRYDPGSQTAEELRPVTAADFVYGIKRGCDPRLGSLYGAVVASVIAGCDVVNQTPDADVTEELVFGNTIAVSAPDETTLVIELQSPAGYFLSMTPMWVLHAVHPETVEEFGVEWAVPGNIATNGPYFVHEITRAVRRVFVRNYNHNKDLDYGGNIDQITINMIEDIGTAFAFYQDNLLDTTVIPAAEIQSVRDNPAFDNELVQIYDQVVYYFGFQHIKPPFDNVHARRAFSAIIDRTAFVEKVRQGRGVPMIHWTPPGIFGAVPINEVGVGFNPEYAREQLAEAGYPNCAGLPEINIITYSGAENWGEFLAAAAEEHLGCSSQIFTIEEIVFGVFPEYGTPTPEDRPNMWTLGWGPEYPDAHNWVFDAGLACESGNDILRPCSELDDLIDQAVRETAPAIREQLYHDIEEGFFGPDGEHPIAPLYMRTSFILVKPWYTGAFETDGLFGGEHWDHRNLDMAAKLAARER